MTQKIYKDGTDQYVMTRLGGIDPETGAQSILMGATEGAALSTLISNLTLVWSQYKQDDESIETPAITWNSTAGMWVISIPSANITQYGTSWLNLSGTGLIPVAIETETVAHMGNKKLLTDTDFTIDISAKTILFADTTIKAGHVLSIRNVTKNADIFYSSRNTGETFLATETPGLFEYSYSGTMAAEDTIQIFINHLV